MQAVVDKGCKATFNELLPNLRIKVKSENTMLEREGDNSSMPGMTKAQRLRLAMPKAVPGTSPITAVPASAAAYKQLVTAVPAERRDQVSSVCQVRVASRDAEHRKL